MPDIEKKSNILVRFGRAISRFFKNMIGEIKKITWPNKPTVIKNTILVIALVLVVGAFIWIADFALSNIVGWILGR